MLTILSNQSFWDPIQRSIKVSVIAVVIVFIVGLLCASFLANKKFKGKLIIETIFMLPLVLPPSVVGFILLIFFGNQSLTGQFITHLFGDQIVFTFKAAIISATVVSFPLMYQTASIGFKSIDRDILEAGQLDGVNWWQQLVKLKIPLARHALITGGILAFARALGEFGATLMIAGNIPGKTQTMPTAIYLAVENNHLSEAWTLVIIMIFISFFMLILVNLQRKDVT